MPTSSPGSNKETPSLPSKSSVTVISTLLRRNVECVTLRTLNPMSHACSGKGSKVLIFLCMWIVGGKGSLCNEKQKPIPPFGSIAPDISCSEGSSAAPAPDPPSARQMREKRKGGEELGSDTRCRFLRPFSDKRALNVRDAVELRREATM